MATAPDARRSGAARRDATGWEEQGAGWTPEHVGAAGEGRTLPSSGLPTSDRFIDVWLERQ